MIKIIPVALFFLSFFASLVSNALLRRVSQKTDILIDRPDKHRKFHKQPTPLTGGIGISIGIIFSAVFLFFLTNPLYFNNFTSSNFLGNNQNILSSTEEIIADPVKRFSSAPQDSESSINEEIFIVDLQKENKLIIKKHGDNSFLMVLPNGEVQIIQTVAQDIEQIDSAFEKFAIFKNEKSQENIFSLNNFTLGLIFFTLLVQAIMIFDDIKGLRAVTRLFLQSLCVLGLILMSDVYLHSFGNLFGFGEIELGFFGIPITIFCIVGVMNAFNMIDGLNGQCASLCLVTFVSVMIITNSLGSSNLFPLILPIGSIVGFLMYNLGIFGEKRLVFLGDNGSNSLGFMCAWVLVYFSSLQESNIAPVTALWLIAVPFIDAMNVMISRVLRGIKPLSAGRDHIHHKLLDQGLSQLSIYIIIISIALILALVGLAFNNYFFEKQYISFYAFILTWIAYYFYTGRMRNV
tara:strand:+ start:6610 stop:7995 length:1386 start_codon:yes stop_codon:yes gene_type:complete